MSWLSKWIGDVFGGGDSNKQQVTQTAMPQANPKQQRVSKELEDLLARRGYFKEEEMGYTPSMISSTTAPYATARRAGFTNYEVPLIASQASARGLGRSTIPVNRIALSGQEAERDIEQRIADLTRESEQLKGQQKAINAQVYQNAITGYSGLGREETAAQQAAYDREAAAAEANRLQAIQTAQNQAIFGTQAAGPILSAISPFLNTIPIVGPALSTGANILSGAATAVSAGKSALVNKSDNDLTSGIAAILKKYGINI